jgi:hypothetical protein
MSGADYSEQCHPLLQEINKFYERFGDESPRFRTKVIGAVTNEIIREHLEQKGISVSNRNVFIAGLPTEWDLIVHRFGAVPEKGCVWNPADVLAVIEIKYSGLYDSVAIQRLKDTFSRLTTKHSHIKPFYFTLMETESARDKVTDETLGCRALTLHWWRMRNRKYVYEITDHWEHLIDGLRTLML